MLLLKINSSFVPAWKSLLEIILLPTIKKVEVENNIQITGKRSLDQISVDRNCVFSVDQKF
jgi:hypothetical protein